MYYKGGRGVVPPWDCQCHAGVVRYETDYGILLMSVCQNSPQGGGGCPKSQTFLSENRESASGLV